MPLNKFEKEKRVIELHLEGKTLKEISREVHMSFRDISKIRKAYDKKIELQEKKKETQEKNQQTITKKKSLSTLSFKLFREGKKPTEVAIELNIPFKKTKKFWAQFLNLERMEDCYEFYQDHRYDIPTFLSIKNFMERNNISGNNDVVNVLRTAKDILNLNQTYSNLKTETKYLEQKRMYLLDYSPRSPYSLQPLPLNKPNYRY
ncbi:MAG TPA: helix-turn-helix domain-containing protein [Nitrososphaeraceae archaeon]|nr:helix-turn-helix domain-containing protein [Nitrososphaeraceae archaeon]